MIEGKPIRPMSKPLNAPIAAPINSTHGSKSGTGTPLLASHPAATLHTANCDPTEMSI
jgi:hypothetical protein